MTVKDYAKRHHSTKRTIEGWIGKGFMPGVEPPVTNNTIIPDDMPVPYRSNGSAKKHPSLFIEVLRAGADYCSVYPDMFKAPADAFIDLLAEMVDKEYITVRQSATGAPYIALTVKGYEFLHQEDKERKTAAENFFIGLDRAEKTLTAIRIAADLAALFGLVAATAA